MSARPPFGSFRRAMALAVWFTGIWMVAALLFPIVAAPMLLIEDVSVFGFCRDYWSSLLRVEPVIDTVDEIYVVIAASIFALVQTAFLVPIVRPGLASSDAKHPLWLSIASAGLLGVCIAGGAAFALIEALWMVVDASGVAETTQSAVLRGFFTGWAAFGALMAWRVWRIGRSREPDMVDRLVRMLLAGTAIELALSVPIYALARKREACFCSLTSFYAIVVGTAGLITLCGPWAALFLTRKARMGWRKSACPRCGYPRRSGSAACSECGESFGGD